MKSACTQQIKSGHLLTSLGKRKIIINPLTILIFYSLTTVHAQTQLGADIDGEAAGDLSGYSVSLSDDGNRLAIGAVFNEGNGLGSGHVRVYDWNGSAWTQLGADIDAEATGDNFGVSVCISADGSRVAVGGDQNGLSNGHVRIFQWNGSLWTQLGNDIDGEANADFFGRSVSLSANGSRIAIGGPGNDGNGFDTGHVQIYQWNGTNWAKLGADIIGEAPGDGSGRAVSLSADGSRVAFGGSSNTGNDVFGGHVRIYHWNGSSWEQLGSDIDGEADENSGWKVSLSADGSRVTIGANRNNGRVRVYQWNGSSWIQLGNTLTGESSDDFFGWAISLSDDGTRLAVGAFSNDGNGTDSGHVRVYILKSGLWTQIDADIEGEAAEDDSGKAVSLSADGTRVAIGNDGNGLQSGHVRVYELQGQLTPVPPVLLDEGPPK